MPSANFLIIGSNITAYALGYYLLNASNDNTVSIVASNKSKSTNQFYMTVPGIVVPPFGLFEPAVAGKLHKETIDTLHEVSVLSRVLELRKDPVAYVFRGKDAKELFHDYHSKLQQSSIRFASLSDHEILDSYPFCTPQDRIIEVHNSLKLNLVDVLESYSKLFHELGGTTENIEQEVQDLREFLANHKGTSNNTVIIKTSNSPSLKDKTVVASFPQVQNFAYTTLIDMSTNAFVAVDIENYLHFWISGKNKSYEELLTELYNVAKLVAGETIINLQPIITELDIDPSKPILSRVDTNSYRFLSSPILELSLAPLLTKKFANNFFLLHKQKELNIEHLAEL